uniref:NR LBD domain-containing protein n=1 Tax=Parastrongyloides trichosuri TaxID=131310 RepID=A0A0N4Z5K8_PARTI
MGDKNIAKNIKGPVIKSATLKELPSKNTLMKLIEWQNEKLEKYSSDLNKHYVIPLVKHSMRPPLKSSIKRCKDGNNNNENNNNELNDNLSQRDNDFKAKVKELTFDLSQSTEFYIPVQKQRWMSVGELSVLYRLKILSQMLGSYTSLKNFQLEIIDKYYEALISKVDSNIRSLIKNYLKGVWSIIFIGDIFVFDNIKLESIDEGIRKYFPKNIFDSKYDKNVLDMSLKINYYDPAMYVRNLEIQTNCLRAITHLIIKAMIDLVDQAYYLSTENKKLLNNLLTLKKIYNSLPNKYYFLETHPLSKAYEDLLNEGPINNGVIFNDEG